LLFHSFLQIFEAPAANLRTVDLDVRRRLNSQANSRPLNRDNLHSDTIPDEKLLTGSSGQNEHISPLLGK
jgi:hypothetical protein